MVRQMLDQQEKKGGRQKWEWENLREEGRAESNSRAGNLVGSDCTMEKDREEHEGRKGIIEERGSCFHLSSKTDGDLEVRILEERMEELNSRICVLECNSDGEEKETSSSDGGYEKDWRWDNGGWWFRAPLIKGNRVNARYRRTFSRMVRQMLNQEEKKGGRQKWEWENLRKKGGAESNLKASNLASNKCTTLNRRGNFLPGPGHGSQHVDRKCSGLQQRPRRQK